MEMIYKLPDRLKELRLKSGMSQQDIAIKLDVTPATISGYERGERTPSLSIVLKLSYIYNCSVDYILGRKQNESNRVYIDVTDLSIEKRKVIDELISFMK